MSLTKIGSIGINTGIQLAGVTTVAEFHVGAGSSVGIGTIDPHTPLHIRSSDTGKLITLSGGTRRNNYLGISGADNLEIAADEDDEGSSSSIRFRIDGSEVARIHSAGRLGIGTISPLAELHLVADNPNIEFNDVNTLSNGEITLDNTQLRIECDEDDAVDSSAIALRVDGSDRVTIGSDGNLNIITGDLTIPDSIAHRADLNTKIRFPENDTISFETVGAERLRIDSNGRLGIGTSSVSTPLHVHHSTTNGVALFESGDVYCNIVFQDANSNESGKPQFGVQGDDFRWVNHNGSDSGERVRIKSNGRVLIGDTTDRGFDGGNNPLVQVADNLSGRWARMSSTTYINSTIGGGIILAHSRNGTVGSHTVVQDDDKLGSIFFEGSDGSAFQRGAEIQAYVDGTPGSDDMPGRIEFGTTADGASSPTTNATLLSNGSFVVGQTSSGIDVGSTSQARLQVKHTTGNISAAFYSTANGSGPGGVLALGHARDTVSGALQEDDVMGEIRFAGGDGTDLESVGASIKGVVNATPGSNDMPGSLVFATTADGSSSPTNRIRLNRNGIFDFINSGTGINFAAGHSVTPNDATVVNNVFDDYEEGELDWEIHKADYLTTGSNTSASKTTYQKIGSMVHVQGYIRTDSTSPSGISNKAAILTDASGNRAQLPFTPSHPGAFIVTHLRSFNDHDDSTFAIGWTINNDDLYVHKVLSNEYLPTSDNATTTNQTNLVICFSGHYHTND